MKNDFLAEQPEDVVTRYQKALKIVGVDDFLYTKVTDSDNVAVFKGTENLPEEFAESKDLKELLSYDFVPYLLIEERGMINWICVGSDFDYETSNDDLVDELTLPRRFEGGFYGVAHVRNIAHPEYGLEKGTISFAGFHEGFVRTDY